jgi:pimeloyl-ACP methyl ester carboxylesterase
MRLCSVADIKLILKELNLLLIIFQSLVKEIMQTFINQQYLGSNNKQAIYDLFLTEHPFEKPLIVFVHGYMGYKDWGAWNLMAEDIQKSGFSIAKLNLTHNGTTVDQPTDFADLEAFGNGGYWKELQDVQLFLNHLEKTHQMNEFILVGHSRGGGVVLLAGQDERVKQVHCLAPICDIESRFPKNEELKQWKDEGVYNRINGRTGQKMPHYYSQYEEFSIHRDELDIEKSCKNIGKPVFVYHGEDDVSVLPIEGEKVAEWTRGEFFLIQNTAHTFDAVEPWCEAEMPTKMKELVKVMSANFKID